MKKTKIIATLGPASEQISNMEEMVDAGLNIVRLNFSHGTHEHHGILIKNIRDVAKKKNKAIGIMQDLQGPKIRVGTLPEKGITLKKGEKIILTINSYKKSSSIKNKSEVRIPVQYKNLYKDVKAGTTILFDDGLLEAKIKKIVKKEIHATIKNGGVLESNKGINAPGCTISADAVTEKDLKDLEFGLKQKVDYIALSFVKSAKDIKEIKDKIKKHKSTAKVIAKIERREALNHLEEIIQEADALMIARGDLGLEVPAEMVPIIQKKMIILANKYAKPIITATQILSSMVKNPIATRAEISDAANAVIDHTDALMLSNETAVGKHPIKAVKTLCKVAKAVEKELQKESSLIPRKLNKDDTPVFDATCLSACMLAQDIHAKYIIALTHRGYTAKQIAKYRISPSIIAMSDREETRRELSLVWGVVKSYLTNKPFELKRSEIRNIILKNNIAKKGDEVVIVNAKSNERNLITTLIL